MTVMVIRENKYGEDVGMWVNTDKNSLYEYYKNRNGKDLELAKILFPNLDEEELHFITCDRKEIRCADVY